MTCTVTYNMTYTRSLELFGPVFFSYMCMVIFIVFLGCGFYLLAELTEVYFSDEICPADRALELEEFSASLTPIPGMAAEHTAYLYNKKRST